MSKPLKGRIGLFCRNFAAALVACGFCLVSGHAQLSNTPQIDGDSPEGILEVNIMSSPGVPLKLDQGMANVTRAEGSSVLRFSATNIGNTPVTGSYAVLFVKDAYGRLKRGEAGACPQTSELKAPRVFRTS
jgi:hypothetical protein